MSDITGNPTPLNVAAPQDVNGTLIPRSGSAAQLETVVPLPGVTVTVPGGPTYPSAPSEPPPPAVPDMPFAAPAVLVGIVVTPADEAVAVGGHTQFTATGTFTEGPPQNITSWVAWTSSNNNVATFSPDGVNGGLATGVLGANSVVVTATLGNLTGTANLHVSA